MPPQDTAELRSTDRFEHGPGDRGSSGAAPPPGPGKPSRTPLAILFLTVFLDLVGFGIVIPLLPLYAEEFGASPVAVTWLVAVYSLMQFAVAPWWGQLSDRHGRRPILLIGLFGSGLSYLFFGLAGTLGGLFAARILAGVMGANIGVAQAYVADVTNERERARGMGMIGAAFGLGFIFGPVIGGLLSQFGMSVPFFAASALAFGNGLLAVVRLPESLGARDRTAGGHSGFRARLRHFRKLTRSSDMGVLYLAFFLITFGFAALEATLSLWADRRWQLTPAGVAYVFAYLGLVVTVVQGTLVGPLVKHLGERRLALVGAGAFAVGLATTPLAASPLGVAIGLAVLAFGQGTAVPAISALISQRAPSTEQGRLLGVSQSLSALGRVVGPIWGGIAFARIGIGAPYLSAALLAVLAMAALGAFLGPAPPAGGDVAPR
ncbi:MAG: MFS transporter [Gemmatimonadota bacterium]